MGAEQRDGASLEPRQLGGVVEIVDDLVAPRQHGGHVQLAGHRLARAGDPPDLGQGLVGTQQRLRRHACPERAFATDEPVLDDGHLEAMIGQPAGRHLAGRSRADDHHIEALHADTMTYEVHPRGRQASTWSVPGVVASRGAGGLVKPGKNKCED